MTMQTSTAIGHSIERQYKLPATRLGLKISERRLLLIFGDLVALTLSAILAIVGWTTIRTDILLDSGFVLTYSNTLAIISVLWFILLIVVGGYSLKVAASIREVISRVLAVFAAYMIIYLTLFFLFAPQPNSIYQLPFWGELPLLRVVPVLFALCALTLQIGWRTAYAKLLTKDQFRRRLLIIGAGRAGRTLLEAFQTTTDSHTYQIVGFIDDDPKKQRTAIGNVFVVGNHLDMTKTAIDHGIDEVVIAVSQDLNGGMFQAVMDCFERGVQITPMPVLYEALTGRVPVEHVGKHWYISLPLSAESPGRLFNSFERGVDLFIGLIGMLLVGVLCPIVVLGNLLGSRGPLFFSQTRVGRTGKTYKILKFRTMIPDAEKTSGAVWAQQNDARITAFGNFLRKCRIDEIPQFWNILKGEMSLIGPRPERPEFVEQLAQQIPFYRSRHAVKPGLTGWAQVKYSYGASVEDSLMKLQYDLYYIKHRSMYLNCLILFKTIGVVIGFKGR